MVYEDLMTESAAVTINEAKLPCLVLSWGMEFILLRWDQKAAAPIDAPAKLVRTQVKTIQSLARA